MERTDSGALARLLGYQRQTTEEEMNDRVPPANTRHQSPPKNTTDDTQWQTRRERMLQDYKSFALSDLKAADERKLRPKQTAPPVNTVARPKTPPKLPVARQTAQQHRAVEYDEAVQTIPKPKAEKSAECLLEQYPPEDLRYSKLMGNWEHTNPYVWADMLFHRKRMQLEQEQAQSRWMYQPTGYERPLQRSQAVQQSTPSQHTPQEDSDRVSSAPEDPVEPDELQYRSVPGHFAIQADITKLHYDMSSETDKLDRILAGIRESAEQSAKDHRDSLKEFEMMKEDLKLRALDAEIRHRTLQSVLDEPFYYAPPTEFTIDRGHLAAQVDSLQQFEPQLITSDSVFVTGEFRDGLEMYADYGLSEGLYDSRREQLEHMRKPYDHRLEVRRTEGVSVAGKGQTEEAMPRFEPPPAITEESVESPEAPADPLPEAPQSSVPPEPLV